MNIKLNPTQTKLFKAIFQKVEGRLEQRTDNPYTHCALWGGYRSGKSYATTLCIFLLCTIYAGANTAIIRESYNTLYDSCIKQMLDAFPPESNGYEYSKTKREAVFNNGSVIQFRAFDVDSKIKSSNYDAILLVQAEALTKDLYLACLGRLSGQAIKRPLIITEGNPGSSFFKQLYIESTEEWRTKNGILYIKGTAHENIANIPKDYIANLEKNYPESFLKRFLWGDWDTVDEQVYTAMMSHHKIKRLQMQPHWYRCVALDHGTVNDSAILFLAKTEHGTIYVFDEWHGKGASVQDLHRVCIRYGSLPVVADFSMKAGRIDAASVWDDLYRTGLNLIESKKDKMANILLVNQLFHTNNLQVFDHCTYTWEQHERYQYKQDIGKENRKEEVVKKDDHSCDALQYGIRYLSDIEVQPPASFAPLARGRPDRPTLDELIKGGYDIQG